MNTDDLIYEDYNNLNDIPLLSDNVNEKTWSSFDYGKLLYKSEEYTKYNFIEAETSKTQNVAYFLEHLYHNNIIKQFKNNYYVDVQNLTFIADKPSIFNFYSNREYEILTDIFDEELLNDTVLSLYNVILNLNDDSFYNHSYACGTLFNVNVAVNQYWQLNDDGEEEPFFVLRYMVNQWAMDMVNEYRVSTEFHNKLILKLCKKLSEEYNIKCYPSYIEYNVGIAYMETKYFNKYI